MFQTVRAAAVQVHAKPRAYQDNRQKIEKLIRQAALQHPSVLVLPEMFLYGHFYEKDRNQYKEPINGPTLAWMKQLSKELNIILIGGINEEIVGEALCYSTTLVVDGDELVGTYRKRHPASAELLFLKPGAESAIFDTRIGKIAVLTCFDMSFPECLTDAFEQRVDLLAVSNAWVEMDKMPFLQGQKFEHHQVLPRALAMQLRAPAVISNMVGPTQLLVPGLKEFGGGVYSFDTEFAGGSLICDHMGVVLDEVTKEAGEGVAVADLNLTFARGTRQVTLDYAGMEEMRRHIF